MCECFIGLSHLMDIIALPDRVSLTLVGFHKFGGERVFHGNSLPIVSKANDPSQCQRRLAVSGHFQRNLIGSTAYSARLRFNARLCVIDGALKNFHRIGTRILLRQYIQGAVNNSACEILLTTIHHHVYDTADEDALELGVRYDGTFISLTTTRHTKNENTDS